jgi:hypothetical protein
MGNAWRDNDLYVANNQEALRKFNEARRAHNKNPVKEILVCAKRCYYCWNKIKLNPNAKVTILK